MIEELILNMDGEKEIDEEGLGEDDTTPSLDGDGDSDVDGDGEEGGAQQKEEGLEEATDEV